MGKKQGLVRTVVGPHGFENRDQTTSHSSLLPFESKPFKKKKKMTPSPTKPYRALGRLNESMPVNGT